MKRIREFILSFIFSLVLSDVAQSEVKNVLFLISDDLKASVLGCYGNEVCETSNIDKLASRSLVFERAYCQGTSCNPSRTSLMHSRYMGKSDMNLGKLFRDNSYYSARVGKIYHMRVPGDIIAGTDGLDVPSSWTERFNSKGLEAHTPGDYACLNLNIFTKELEGRQSTKMPKHNYRQQRRDAAHNPIPGEVPPLGRPKRGCDIPLPHALLPEMHLSRLCLRTG